MFCSAKRFSFARASGLGSDGHELKRPLPRCGWPTLAPCWPSPSHLRHAPPGFDHRCSEGLQAIRRPNTSAIRLNPSVSRPSSAVSSPRRNWQSRRSRSTNHPSHNLSKRGRRRIGELVDPDYRGTNKPSALVEGRVMAPRFAPFARLERKPRWRCVQKSVPFPRVK